MDYKMLHEAQDKQLVPSAAAKEASFLNRGITGT